MKFKIFLIGLFVSFVFVLIGMRYAVEHILPYSIIKPLRCSESVNKIIYRELEENQIFYEKFDVLTKDSVNLKAIYINSLTSESGNTIILLHGIGACKVQGANRAILLAKHSYNVVLFDLRSHGESGGQYCTYGYYEKEDLTTLIDDVLKRYGSNQKIAVWGSSLGGAVAIQAMALDKRIKAGIIESTFANMRGIVHDYAWNLMYIPFDFISDKAIYYAERIAKFKADEVNPEESAKLIEQPVLMIHGVDDKRISIRYGMCIFKNLKSEHKEWYPVKGAGHLNVPIIGGKIYENKVLDFFDKYFK
jgi:uncharacterized protein